MAFVTADSVYKSIIPSLDSVIRIFFEKKENQDLHLMGRFIKTCKAGFEHIDRQCRLPADGEFRRIEKSR